MTTPSALAAVAARLRLALDPVRLGHDPDDPRGDRGSGVVEWLGISALSIALLVTVFSVLEQVGLDMVGWIRQQLGVG